VKKLYQGDDLESIVEEMRLYQGDDLESIVEEMRLYQGDDLESIVEEDAQGSEGRVSFGDRSDGSKHQESKLTCDPICDDRCVDCSDDPDSQLDRDIEPI
jgi:hypothetical protein